MLQNIIFKRLLLFIFVFFSYHASFSAQNALNCFNGSINAAETDANSNGINEPVLSKLMERDVRIPHTLQYVDGKQANLISISVEEALGAKNILNNEIVKVSNPHDDLLEATDKLSETAENGEIDKNSLKEIINILLGTTSGRIYDGFSLLNFNRWNEPSITESAFPDDAVIGDYKTKVIRHSGNFERNFKKSSEGVNPDLILDEDDEDKIFNEVTIWEVDVNMFWYGQQFDSDTFFIYVPILNSVTNVPSADDTIRINYHIYSLIDEDFAPTQMLFDANPGTEFPNASVRLPHKGEDTVWTLIKKNTVTHVTVQHSAFRFLRGIYTWGWRSHPPRIHFLDFLFELKNAHTEELELDPRSKSMSIRNKELNIDGIGNSAPEKKIYNIAIAALNNEITAEELFDMLNNPDIEPKGSYPEWIDLMSNQLQLPPEVNEILANDGKSANDYDFVSVFLNNEMYGTGPLGGNIIREWEQGDTIHNRIFNMDNHPHYYRNVDFGPALHSDINENSTNGSGIFSFEIMNFKPMYGAPKAAEIQWRTGWGFRPHYSIIQQDDVFPGYLDKDGLKPFAAPVLSLDNMALYYGYQYSQTNRRGDFIFDPPRYIIEREKNSSKRIQIKDNRRSFESFYEFTKKYPSEVLETYVNQWDNSKKEFPKAVKKGVTIGQRTEGFGLAKMCNHKKHVGDFCTNDLSEFHPLNIKNFDTDRNVNDALFFPTFLINPNKDGGDIIPPTPAWEPFLYLSPNNGTIYIDPNNKEKGYWADLTYAHGKPIPAMDNIEVNIEMPREKGQLFYQFDDLFHDNDIFSPHPVSSQR